MLEQLTVARYLAQRIALSGKTQRAIASECGYPNANIVTMFKNGRTRLPFNKVAIMARALEVDPRDLLRLVLSEYTPDALAMLEEVMAGATMLSTDEAAVLALIRGSSRGRVPRLDDLVARDRLVTTISEIARAEDARDAAAVARLDSLPSNARNR